MSLHTHRWWEPTCSGMGKPLCNPGHMKKISKNVCTPYFFFLNCALVVLHFDLRWWHLFLKTTKQLKVHLYQGRRFVVLFKKFRFKTEVHFKYWILMNLILSQKTAHQKCCIFVYDVIKYCGVVFFFAADNVYSVVSDKWPSYITLSVWTCNLSSPLDPGTFFYSVWDTIKNRG